MSKQPECPKCKSEDNIIVETEMSGFMITPVRNGEVVISEQYFHGDVCENVKCSLCNTVLDVDSVTDLDWEGYDRKNLKKLVEEVS